MDKITEGCRFHQPAYLKFAYMQVQVASASVVTTPVALTSRKEVLQILFMNIKTMMIMMKVLMELCSKYLSTPMRIPQVL